MRVHKDKKMSITYREKNDKYILCKDGVYFALTPKQVIELKAVVQDIIDGTRKFYKEDARSD